MTEQWNRRHCGTWFVNSRREKGEGCLHKMKVILDHLMHFRTFRKWHFQKAIPLTLIGRLITFSWRFPIVHVHVKLYYQGFFFKVKFLFEEFYSQLSYHSVMWGTISVIPKRSDRRVKRSKVCEAWCISRISKTQRYFPNGYSAGEWPSLH